MVIHGYEWLLGVINSINGYERLPIVMNSGCISQKN